METKNEFQWYIPLQKNTLENVSYKLNENGSLDIEGIASTINKDLQGDVMLPSAIESMKNQILAMGKNLHGDHEPFLFRGLLGAVNKVYETDNDKLGIGATVLSKYAPDIKEMIDIGVNLGFSIGGAATKYKINKSNGLDISDVYLREVSLTAVPANLETLGTVTTQKGVVSGTCLGGICHELTKNVLKKNNTREEEIKMSGEEKNNQEETKPQDEDLDSKIKNIVDELWAEKQQGIVDAVVKEVRSEIKNLVQEAMNPEEQGGTNEDVEKSFNPKDLGKVIAKAVQTEMNDFKKQFFKNVDNNRNPQSDVDLQKQEDLLNNKKGEQLQKTYSTEETAKILMKRQRTVNPIMGAVLNNLGE